MSRVRLIPLFLLAISSTALAAGQLATDAELQQMFDKGDYRACLQQTARVLGLKGEAANNYDPYTMQMRRGECLLSLGDSPTALERHYNLARAQSGFRWAPGGAGAGDIVALLRGARA